MTPPSALLPCPFCGEPPEISAWRGADPEDDQIICVGLNPGKEHVIINQRRSVWNRRATPPTREQVVEDAGAKILSKFIGLAWDGLTPDARPKGYPMWAYDGAGHHRYQGGKEGLREIAASISAATRQQVAEEFASLVDEIATSYAAKTTSADPVAQSCINLSVECLREAAKAIRSLAHPKGGGL